MDILKELNHNINKKEPRLFIVVEVDKPENESEFYQKLAENDIQKGYTDHSVKYGLKGSYYLEVSKKDLEKLKKITDVKSVIKDYERGCFRASSGTYHIDLYKHYNK
jgi:hypothetical protein